jgi:hypothetical protein
LAFNAGVVMAFRKEPLMALGCIVFFNAGAAAVAAWQVRRLVRRPFFSLMKREAARDAGTVFKGMS